MSLEAFDLIDSTYDTSLAVFDEYCDEELQIACDEDGHGDLMRRLVHVTVDMSPSLSHRGRHRERGGRC